MPWPLLHPRQKDGEKSEGKEMVGLTGTGPGTSLCKLHTTSAPRDTLLGCSQGPETEALPYSRSVGPADGSGRAGGRAQPLTEEGAVKALVPVAGEAGRRWDWLQAGVGWRGPRVAGLAYMMSLPALTHETPCKIRSLTSRVKQHK